VPVSEKVSVAPGGQGLLRTFEVGVTNADLWIVAPAVPGVKVSSSAGELSNGKLKIPGGKPQRFTVTVQPQ